VYPQPKILSYSFWVNTTDYDDKKSIWPAAAYLCSELPRLNRDGGFQGYFNFFPNAISANFLAPNEFADADNMRKVFDPVLKKIEGMPGIDKKTFIKIPPAKLSASSLGNLQTSTGEMAGPPKEVVGGGQTHGHRRLTRRHGPGEMSAMARGTVDIDSRLLGDAELNHPKLAEALEKALPRLPNGMLRSHLVGGNKVLKLGNDTSVLPAWRKAFVHIIGSTADGTPNIQSLRDISPDMGAYINEVST
jgi:hypothetical protein